MASTQLCHASHAVASARINALIRTMIPLRLSLWMKCQDSSLPTQAELN
jgi:hypothetical protein